jgi:hypothetical protein
VEGGTDKPCTFVFSGDKKEAICSLPAGNYVLYVSNG